MPPQLMAALNSDAASRGSLATATTAMPPMMAPPPGHPTPPSQPAAAAAAAAATPHAFAPPPPPPPSQPPPPSAGVRATHPLSRELKSAYGHVGEPQCTTFHKGFQGTVDYILLTFADFIVETVMPLPSHADLARRGSLPDLYTPSDHIPIACELSWRRR